jgi:hypothetical protein
MRFFSSSALANAPKLRLAASCSAAEAILDFLPPLLRRYARGRATLYRTPDIIWGYGFDKSIVPHA